MEGSAALALVDINDNGTGFPDVVSFSKTHNRIDWYHKDTNYFKNPEIIDDNISGVTSIDYADFNGDGKFDIVAASQNENRIVWYQNDNNGNDTYTIQTIDAVIKSASSVTTADINGDGKIDIVSTSFEDGKIYWHQNDTNEEETEFSQKYTIAEGLNAVKHTSVVDMDGDGDMDVLSSSSEILGKIVWYENIGENDNFPEHIVARNVENVAKVYVGDIDNDRDMDVVAGYLDGKVIIYENINTDKIMRLPKTGEEGSFGADRNYTRDDINNMVTDHLTGLMWQDNEIVSKKWSNAVTYCEGLTLGDYDDWRLPEIEELYYLIDLENSSGFDTTFENHSSDKSYWSANIRDGQSVYWYLIGSDSRDGGNDPNNDKGVRCVRGEIEKSKFIRHTAQNVVVDHQYALIWQDNQTSETEKVSWQEAKDACEDLELGGYADWRLPNMFEIYSIYDRTKRNVATNTVFQNFNANATIDLWSSSSHEVNGNTIIYGIEADIGRDRNIYQNNNETNYFRCVRSMD
jgi:hypothetical protein